MITDTIRKTAMLSLATLLAGGALAACATSATEDQPLDVAGASAALYDNDHDGHDDYNDSWRFKGKKGDQGRRRNICPLVEGFAQPNSIQVGQSTKVFGYSIDFDGPKRLVSKWSVSDPTMGTFANASSKRTSFKCLKAGVAHLSFTGYDGDCLRESKFNVHCKGTTPIVCGDGKTQAPETCDGSNCPTAASCNDGNPCTTDVVSGDAAKCTAVCTHTAVTTCTAGDGCCLTAKCANPADATHALDLDCTLAPPNPCGNGVLDSGETCDDSDPAHKCATTCADTNPCTKDTLTGTAANCNVMCTNVANTTCDNATVDGCCPTTCNANTDKDCPVRCGNSAIEPGETCDPLSSCPTACNDGNACTVDKVLNPGTCNATCDSSTKIETCVSGDGCCPSICANPADATHGLDTDCKPTPLKCGNGILDSDETCDNSSATKCKTTCNDNQACTNDSLTGSADTCNVKCTNSPVTTCSAPIGDGCCPSGSTCNANNDIDCLPLCGNGFVEGDETCDNGTPNCVAAISCDDNLPCTDDVKVLGSDGCHATCTHVPTSSASCNCGNGKLDNGETCDNSDPTHQCPPADCDDNNPCTNDVATGSACTLACTHPPVSSTACNCNNGKLDVGETCDNSSPTASEKCPASCPASSDPCSPKVLTGSATTCSAACVDQPITTCTTGDGCCNKSIGCTKATDNECPGDPCLECEMASHGGNNSCPNALRSCQNLTGLTSATSPMPGVSKGLLCQQIVDCIHTTHCAKDFNVTDCICGEGVQADLCFAGTYDAATGPCKALIAAGAESNLMPVIAANFSDAGFAIGVADTLIESCDYLSCNECILP